jgi:hypothetical protein
MKIQLATKVGLWEASSKAIFLREVMGGGIAALSVYPWPSTNFILQK